MPAREPVFPICQTESQNGGVGILKGSDSTIESTTAEILRLISPGMDEAGKTVRESLNTLRQEIESLREQINYDYADYECRMYVPGRTEKRAMPLFQKVFEQRILPHPIIAWVLKPLRNFFQSDSFLAEHSEIWNHFLEKLKMAYFDDLVYESMTVEERSTGVSLSKRVSKNPLEKILRELRETNIQKIKKLDLSYSLEECFTFSEMRVLIEESGKLGFKILDLSFADLWKNLRLHEISELVKTIGNARFRSVDLGGNQLFESMGTSGVIDLLQVAGESGIRKFALDRSNTGMQFFCQDDTCKLVHAAGGTKIKFLSLRGNYLWNRLGMSGMVAMAQEAGKSGILSLGLASNLIWGSLGHRWLRNFVSEAGKSGIRYLNISSNGLADHISVSQLIEIIREAQRTGIQYLNVANNEYTDSDQCCIIRSLTDEKLPIQVELSYV